MQTEFYTNLNKKVDVILFFIYWTKHVHVMLNNILGDDVGARPSHCTVGPGKVLCGFMTSTLVATREKRHNLPDIVILQQRGGMINKVVHILYSKFINSSLCYILGTLECFYDVIIKCL